MKPLHRTGARITKFFTELRHRRVFRVGAAYGLVGWFLIQLADVIVEPLGLPEWVSPLVIVTVFLGFPIAILLAWAFDLTPEGVERAPLIRPDTTARPSDVLATETAGAGVDAERSVAVLPFADLSRAPENEYFSDGITDDLITHLSKISDLRVISRTSVMRFKDAKASLRDIGGELGVSNVLEGSVRLEGNRIRINAQLIDVRSDDHLWVETYDRELEDIFSIQLDVATRIAESLHARLSGPEQAGLQALPTADMEAYDLFLKGRHHWNRRTQADLAKSVDYLERAVERDPEYAAAWAGLADSLVTLGVYGASAPGEVMPRARKAAEQSLELAGSAEAHVAIGSVRGIYDWDWPGAEASFRTAIDLEPGYALAHHWYAMNCLLPLGRFEAGRESLARAAERDPLSPAIRASFGILALFERRFEEGIEDQQRLVATDPAFGLAHYIIGSCHERLGRFPEAIAAFREAVRASGMSVETVASLGHALARGGQAEEARRLLEELRTRGQEAFVSPTRIAQIHLGLGERDPAFDALEQAAEMRAADLMWIGVSPAWDELRGEDRFEKVSARVLDSAS